MIKERDYTLKWGYTFKEILEMQREDFCQIYGNRYLEMSLSKFKRVIMKETPFRTIFEKEIIESWRPDANISKKDYINLHYGRGWDVNGQEEIL